MIGIGRETAITLARAGWSLVLFARRGAQLLETKQACPDPDSCIIVEGDVTSEEDVRKLFELAVERFGAFTRSLSVRRVPIGTVLAHVQGGLTCCSTYVDT